MTYLAGWLLAVAGADLVRPGGSLPRRRGRVGAIGAGLGVLVVLWALCGARADRGLLVWGALAVLLVVWVLESARAIDAGRTTPVLGACLVPATHWRAGRRVPGRVRRATALSALVGGGVLALVANGSAPPPADPLLRWYAGLHLRSLSGHDLPHVLLVAGVLAAQVGTANVVVRLALDGAGARSEPGVLRGGRLLGPLERLFIVGLGLAGQVTAASVVIAAKGVLRFPEISKQTRADQRIDAVTEYFLVGSFVSWLVALLGICLARA